MRNRTEDKVSAPGGPGGRLAVFGAAFDPPHLGHMAVVRQALGEFDRIILVPAAAHPFGKQPAPLATRLRLLHDLVAEQFGADPELLARISCSGIEQRLLVQKGRVPIYTYELLTALEREQGPAVQLQFVVGPDNAAPQVWRQFYKYEEVAARWGLWVAREERLVRSSTVRQLLQAPGRDRPSLQAELVPLVGPQLAKRLAASELYRTNSKEETP